MVIPTRIGVIDMGSNAIRFQIAELAGGVAAVLESHRLPVRLGQQVFETGQISEETIAAVVDGFRRFRASCERLQVGSVRAIATSAMRDAGNRDLLIDRLREVCGVEIEVISGTQEAYLLQLGVGTKLDLKKGRSLLVDVGGGSVEVVVADRGEVVAADSYRLGALRMLQTFSSPSISSDGFVELLTKHLRSLERRIADRFGEQPFDRYAAVGGNIETIADLVAAQHGPQKQDGVDVCSLAEVRKKALELAALPLEERIAKHGLRPDRADTIVPAGIVYAHLGTLAGVDKVAVPRVGIKDGLMQELVAGHVQPFAPEDHADVVLQSCRAMGRRFHYERDHAETVRTLARRLFDETRNLHGLDERARVFLEAAALLHDVGVAVNNDGHHKHSQYLIESSEIVGLSDEERSLVALLARYHRKAPPSREHEEFARLRRHERMLVERLSALLRLADALDRQHASVVADVRVVQRGQWLELQPMFTSTPQSLLPLETQAVADKGGWFAQLFGKKPILTLPTPA
jgi:exopolyphosphatase/guanosine-5'-triphosphate,3'-diphosphate pyrophosphatase